VRESTVAASLARMVLVIPGSLLVLLMAFLAIVLALFGEGAWEAVAGMLLTLSMGVLGAIGGVRILRGTPPRRATESS
jgi:hypothetical protein